MQFSAYILLELLLVSSIHNHVMLCMTLYLALCVPASMITEICLHLSLYRSSQCFWRCIHEPFHRRIQVNCIMQFSFIMDARMKMVAAPVWSATTIISPSTLNCEHSVCTQASIVHLSTGKLCRFLLFILVQKVLRDCKLIVLLLLRSCSAAHVSIIFFAFEWCTASTI